LGGGHARSLATRFFFGEAFRFAFLPLGGGGMFINLRIVLSKEVGIGGSALFAVILICASLSHPMNFRFL
jgi:hypothetical protein